MARNKPAPPVQEVPAEPKILNKWGSSEAQWELDHEDALITVNTRSGKEFVGYLIGVDHYTVTVEDHNKNVTVIFKHAIDTMS